MKTYVGTKTVKAEPMNELAAVEKGYARKNKDNHEWREGYHVQYTNPDGSIYNSWSPKRPLRRLTELLRLLLTILRFSLKN